MSDSGAETWGVEVWRGGVNTWDCDGMGHLNVRFYVAFAMEGLASLAAELGLPHAFSPEAPSTLVVREHHIRFLREARDHAVLHMRAGVVEIGESDALIVQVLYHSMTGEPCAAIQTRVSHVTAQEMRPFPWSAKVLDWARALMVDLPEIAKARSLSQAPPGEMSLERADVLGLQSIGLGLINPVDCDAFGRMAAHHAIGHVSDGITGMVTPFRQAVVDHSETRPQRFGGAALEYRLVYLVWPRVGDRFTIRSGNSAVDARAMRMTHWMLDPLSGKPWGGAEAVVTTFDLERRKIVPISEAAQAMIGAWITPELML